MALTIDSNALDSLSFDSDSFVDLFNSGSLDLQGLLDDSDVEMPPSTVSAPAVPATPTPNEKNNEQPQQKPGPSGEEIKRLEQIEQMLMGLENKIDEINAQDKENGMVDGIDNFEAVTKTSPLDGFNNSRSTENSGPVVEVLENKSVLNSREFNKEVLTTLTQQKNLLFQEREKILKSQLGGLQNNNNINNENITNLSEENTTNSFTNEAPSINPGVEGVLNTNENNNFDINSPNNQSFKDINNIQNAFSQETQNLENKLSQTDNSFFENNPSMVSSSSIEGDTIQNNQTENLYSQPGSENVENIFNTENITNSSTNTTDLQNLVGEPMEGGSPEGFFNQQQNQAELPQPQNEIEGNAAQITALLEGIKQGIDGLSSGLGNNFSNLSKSMEGMKNTVINNSYSGGSGGQGSPQSSQGQNNNTSMRETIPDYRLDHAFPDDVPTGIVDATRMQGTNLPNPVFIL